MDAMNENRMFKLRMGIAHGGKTQDTCCQKGRKTWLLLG